MAVPTSFTKVRRDDVHIFSEFEDEERQYYIQRILAMDHDSHDSIQRITRASLSYLWFADKKIPCQMTQLEGDWCKLPRHLSPAPFGPVAVRRPS